MVRDRQAVGRSRIAQCATFHGLVLCAITRLPVSEDWAATLHSDFYWQSQSFARVFNDRPYDKFEDIRTSISR